MRGFLILPPIPPHQSKKPKKYKIPLPYKNATQNLPKIYIKSTQTATKFSQISLKNNQKMLKFSRIVLLEVKPKRDCIMLLLITIYKPCKTPQAYKRI
ncbi:hypothetical protein [Helicobacter sp. T3_23-1056]